MNVAGLRHGSGNAAGGHAVRMDHVGRPTFQYTVKRFHRSQIDGMTWHWVHRQSKDINSTLAKDIGVSFVSQSRESSFGCCNAGVDALPELRFDHLPHM
jgi:hypothetical protein